MPGGNVDFFVVSANKDKILDYLGLEIQSLDTTGSGGIWNAREDLRINEYKENYGYGINWKMTAKTILIQLHHKGEAFQTLNKKLILAIQNPFFTYIKNEFNAEDIRDPVNTDAIHFHIYDCLNLNDKYQINLSKRFSTNVLGIEKLLKLGREGLISEEDVIQKILDKMDKSIPLNY